MKGFAIHYILLLISITYLSSCQSTTNYVFQPLRKVIKKHRTETTYMDGERCPFYPSCSKYADQALEKHGFLGLWIFIDRLFYREHARLGKKYKLLREPHSRHLHYYDPISDSLPVSQKSKPSFLQENFYSYR